jgi:chromosome segregation ATPase
MGDSGGKEMTTRDEAVKKMKAKLDEWNAQMDELEKEGKDVSAELKTKYDAQLKEVRKHSDAVKAKIEKLMASGEGAWEDAKGEAEHAWEAFVHSVNYFKSHFK